MNEKGVYLRTNPFSFLEIDAGAMLGVRYKWNKKFSAVLDPTFIFFNPYRGNFTGSSHPVGIKIRADIRYHINKPVFKRSRLFIAPEFHYKYRVKERLATFGINCINGNCAYYMEDIYKEIKTEIGGAAKAGFDIPIDARDRFAFELYGGLGLKVFQYKESSIPIGGSFFSEPSHQDFLGTSEGTATPIFFGSLKLSYRLR